MPFCMRKLLVFVVLLPSIVSPTRVVSWVWEDARGLDRERPTWGERWGWEGGRWHVGAREAARTGVWRASQTQVG